MHNAAESSRALKTQLEQACETDLSHATMHRFSHIFNDRFLTRNRARSPTYFCPVCVKGDDVPKVTPLLWEILCVRACPIHKVQLQEAECGAPRYAHLSTIERPNLPGVCKVCGSIGHECLGISRPVAASPGELWVAEQVGKLLSLSTEESAALRFEDQAEAIAELVRTRFKGSRQALGRGVGVAKNTALAWGVTSPPALGYVVQACLMQRLDIVEFLRGRTVTAPGPRVNKDEAIAVLGFERRHNWTPYTQTSLQEALRAALQEYPVPISAEMERRLKTHRTRMARWAPEEYAALVRASSAQRQEKWDETYRKNVAKLVEVGRQIQSVGGRLTKTGLIRLSGLRTYTGFKDSRRKAALDEALRILTGTDGASEAK